MTENQNALPEHDLDLPERVAAFNTALQPLLGKYELGLSSRSELTPDGRVVSMPVIVSMRKAPEPKAEEKVVSPDEVAGEDKPTTLAD